MISFKINRRQAFNIATYPFLGFQFNSREGGTLGIEIPVVGEFFFGKITDMGGFIGGGVSYAFAADDYFSGSLIGPQISGGGQFDIRDRLVKFRVALTFGLIKNQEPDIDYTKDSRTSLTLMATYPIGQ